MFTINELLLNQLELLLNQLLSTMEFDYIYLDVLDFVSI